MKMNSTRLPKFNFKNSLGINKEYIQKELFKSINKNKKMSGNSSKKKASSNINSKNKSIKWKFIRTNKE